MRNCDPMQSAWSSPKTIAAYLAYAAITGAMLGGFFCPAYALTTIDGESNSLHIEADNAPISEVLTACANKFNLTVKGVGQLRDVVTGSYSGTLPKVLRRVLQGYNYLIEKTPTGFNLQIIGPSDKGSHPATNVANAANVIVQSAYAGNVPPPPSPSFNPGRQNAAPGLRAEN